MKKLAEEIAVVTGVSHSQGIGAAICRKFAQDGADLLFTHWNSKAHWPDEFQKELLGFGGRVEHVESDLSDSTSPFHILDLVSSKLGLPTILINNAAYSESDGYQKLNAKILDDHYAVNMRSTFLLSVEFARRLQQNKISKGRIINLTSGQGLGPMQGELAYASTKGAISAFTVSLSAELAPHGITVNAVNPGPTDTGWMTNEIKQTLHPKFLSGRIGQPEDAARLITFLASNEAQWITGQIINSEGGFLRG